MLLDDTQQCIYFGRGQVMTYDKLDELRGLRHKCSLYKKFRRDLFIYDRMVEDTGVKLFKLKQMVT